MHKLIRVFLLSIISVIFLGGALAKAEEFSPSRYFCNPIASAGINTYGDADIWLEYLFNLRTGLIAPPTQSQCKSGIYMDLLSFLQQQATRDSLLPNLEGLIAQAATATTDEKRTAKSVEIFTYVLLMCGNIDCFLRVSNISGVHDVLVDDGDLPKSSCSWVAQKLHLRHESIILKFDYCESKIRGEFDLNGIFDSISPIITGKLDGN